MDFKASDFLVLDRSRNSRSPGSVAGTWSDAFDMAFWFSFAKVQVLHDSCLPVSFHPNFLAVVACIRFQHAQVVGEF